MSVLVCYELERVLQCLEAIDAVVPLRELRWVAVHVTQASAHQLERMHRLGLIATVTPGFMQHAADRFGLLALGAAGTPIRALLDAGVPVALSTDGVPHSMLFALWQARARRDGESGVALGDSQLTREEALRLATVAGHRLSWTESHRGTLKAGNDADLVVLPQDPMTCDWEALATLQAATASLHRLATLMCDRAAAQLPACGPAFRCFCNGDSQACCGTSQHPLSRSRSGSLDHRETPPLPRRTPLTQKN